MIFVTGLSVPFVGDATQQALRAPPPVADTAYVDAVFGSASTDPLDPSREYLSGRWGLGIALKHFFGTLAEAEMWAFRLIDHNSPVGHLPRGDAPSTLTGCRT